MAPVDHFKLIWSKAEKLGTLASLILLLAMILGFRVDRPNDRFARLEHTDSLLAERISLQEKEQGPMRVEVSMLLRLRCLSMTHKEVVMLNVCDGYKTAEDTARAMARR